MTDLEKLLALEEIKMMRAKWCRLVDAHRWPDLEEILTPDCTLDLSATRRSDQLTLDRPPVKGAKEICKWLAANVGAIPQQLHIVTMPEITFTSDTTANGIWRQESFIPTVAGREGKSGIAYGTLRDTYAKIDGRWLMRTIEVSVDLVT